MKKWLSVISVLIFVILSELSLPAGLSAGGSIENPTVRSPVVSGTVPPSSTSNGLIQTPNPVDSSGNLVITGNVTGGKHFRGLVPYGSPTNFQSRLGTSSLDSFLRYSTDSVDFGGYAADGSSSFYSTPEAATGLYRPFFSPTGTVATTKIDGRVGLRQSWVSADELALQAEPGARTLSGVDTAADHLGLRPAPEADLILSRASLWSRTPQELERLIFDEIGKEFRQEVKQIIDDRVAESKQSLKPEGMRNIPMEAGMRFQPTVEVEPSEIVKRFETRLGSRGAGSLSQQSASGGPQAGIPTFPQTRPSLQSQQRVGVFPSDRAGLDELIAAAEKKAELTQKQTEKQLDVYEQIKQRLDDLIKPDATRYPMLDAQKGEKSGIEYQESRIELGTGNLMLDEDRESRIKVRESEDVSDRAKTVLGEHESFASFSNDRFTWYIKAAQVYLKQGRYYRAADAYTLASVYKAEPEALALAYAGKSHALFAAGEYMSSALFLSRALAAMPQYARYKVDLVDIVGDKSKLEHRLADVEQRLQISGAAELQFLLGYIYYQTGRFDAARKAIDAAYQKMPDSEAVAAVKKAIEQEAPPVPKDK